MLQALVQTAVVTATRPPAPQVVLQKTLGATFAFLEEQISAGFCWVCCKSTRSLCWLNGFGDLVHKLDTSSLSPIQSGGVFNIIIRSFVLTGSPWSQGECQAPQAGEKVVHNMEMQAPREQQYQTN